MKNMKQKLPLFLTSVLRDNDLITLPQNLLSYPGDLLEDFEDTTGWTITSGSGTIQADTEHVIHGNASLKMTTEIGAAQTIAKNIGSYDMSADRPMRFWVYKTETSAVNPLRISLSYHSNFGDGYSYYTQLAAADPGWYMIHINRSDWTTIGSPAGWEVEPMRYMRLTLTPLEETSLSLSVDYAIYNVLPQPVFVFTFDDSVDTAYNTAEPIMSTHHMKGTVYNIGSGLTATRIAKNKKLEAQGWIMGNHTQTHANLTLLTREEQAAEIAGGRATLEAAGIFSGSRHVAYPGGIYNADTKLAANDAGMITGRTGRTTGNSYLPFYGGQFAIRNRQSFDNTLDLSEAITWVDEIITNKEVGVGIFHTLVSGSASSSTEWNIDDFIAIMSYVASLKAPVLTIDELYQLTLGSLKVKLPI